MMTVVAAAAAQKTRTKKQPTTIETKSEDKMVQLLQLNNWEMSP